jgi:hypothetical protein
MNCANHPERERFAFCQNCGKALCQECARTVGTAVFCEPCLAARIAGSTGTGPAASGPYAPPPSGVPGPPLPTGEPNPGLAAMLGFIPGVGAMYNGQYAKGIVHLIIFAILVSLADEHGIFGLFIAGWVFYQVFEAYQTARARRDGTPLPNPFGLNDLGERLGFGRAWPASPTATAVPPGPEPEPVPPATPYAPPAAAYQPPPPGSAAWQNYAPPAAAAWQSYAPPAATGWNYQSGNNPYLINTPAFDPNLPAPRNRFPAGAIWLIGLGAIFLIGNTGLFHGFPMHQIIPIFLIGLGCWLFYHKMTATGAGIADDGTPLYRMRLFSALRGSIWVVLVGVMFLLSSFTRFGWGKTWPLFIIVAGLMTFFERTAYHSVAVPPAYSVPPVTPPPSATTIIPPAPKDDSTDQYSQEGR